MFTRNCINQACHFDRAVDMFVYKVPQMPCEQILRLQIPHHASADHTDVAWCKRDVFIYILVLCQQTALHFCSTCINNEPLNVSMKYSLIEINSSHLPSVFICLVLWVFRFMAAFGAERWMWMAETCSLEQKEWGEKTHLHTWMF